MDETEMAKPTAMRPRTSPVNDLVSVRIRLPNNRTTLLTRIALLRPWRSMRIPPTREARKAPTRRELTRTSCLKQPRLKSACSCSSAPEIMPSSYPNISPPRRETAADNRRTSSARPGKQVSKVRFSFLAPAESHQHTQSAKSSSRTPKVFYLQSYNDEFPSHSQVMCKGMCTHSHHSPDLHTLPWTAMALLWVQNHENRAVLTVLLLGLVFKWQTVVCFSGAVHGTL